MPTYDFQCNDCQDVFEVFTSISAKERGLDLTCEKCGSKDINQAITSCLFYSPGSAREPAHSHSHSSSKCGGCHSGNCGSCH